MITMQKNKNGDVRLNEQNQWVFIKDGDKFGLTPNHVIEMRELFDGVLYNKSNPDYEYKKNREKRLQNELIKVRDLLSLQADKNCLGVGNPIAFGDCAPWPIVDEVINSITQALAIN